MNKIFFFLLKILIFCILKFPNCALPGTGLYVRQWYNVGQNNLTENPGGDFLKSWQTHPKTSSTEAKLRQIPASTAMSNMFYIMGGLSVIHENKIMLFMLLNL